MKIENCSEKELKDLANVIAEKITIRDSETLIDIERKTTSIEKAIISNIAFSALMAYRNTFNKSTSRVDCINSILDVAETIFNQFRPEANGYLSIYRPLIDLMDMNDWIPVKDPKKELPKDEILWVTRENSQYRWVDTLYYDMTEWSDDIDNVVAYMIAQTEPRPYYKED